VSGRRHRPSDQRGGALIAVVAGLALFAALALGATALMRGGAAAARADLDVAAARHAADSGISLAIALLVDGDARSRPPTDGSEIRLDVHGARLAISVSDEAGRIDLNTGAVDLMAGAFEAAGLTQDAARRLALAVGNRRRAERFIHPAELRLLADLSGPVMRQVLEAVTVHGAGSGIDPRVAPRAALLGVPGLDVQTVDTYLATRQRVGASAPQVGRAHFTESPASAFRITVTAELPGGVRHRVTALVRLTQELKRPYVVVDWR